MDSREKLCSSASKVLGFAVFFFLFPLSWARALGGKTLGYSPGLLGFFVNEKGRLCWHRCCQSLLLGDSGVAGQVLRWALGSAPRDHSVGLSLTLWLHVHTTHPLSSERLALAFTLCLSHSHRTNWSLLLLAMQSGLSAVVIQQTVRAAPSPQCRSRAAAPVAGSACWERGDVGAWTG